MMTHGVGLTVEGLGFRVAKREYDAVGSQTHESGGVRVLDRKKVWAAGSPPCPWPNGGGGVR